eukprot:6214233-Pleurochrysis_carterae.AAC.2
MACPSVAHHCKIASKLPTRGQIQIRSTRLVDFTAEQPTDKYNWTRVVKACLCTACIRSGILQRSSSAQHA